MQLEKNYSLLKRFWIYQKERFPVFSHGLLITTFTFSAVSYSLMCRGANTFISLAEFLPGLYITFSLFFLLRLFDEFKDKKEDALYRKYLPVPRGLVSIKELRVLSYLVFISQFAVIYFFQLELLTLYLFILLYLLLMRVEFFVPNYLKKRQILYITSHMFILPFVDIYASAMDWKVAGVEPPVGLLWFFLLSYFNGLVLEFGRKLKTEDTEEKGVVSYTKMYGINKAVLIWGITLFFTYASAMLAGYYAQYNYMVYLCLSLFVILAAIPAYRFVKQPTPKRAKSIELASGIWALLMYLSLGAIPMLYSFIH